MEDNDFLKKVISEKSYSMANAENKYTFYVPIGANKIEVKRVVEKEYDVKVDRVRSMVMPGKVKWDWNNRCWIETPARKKVIVQVAKDDRIEDYVDV